jgi:hypothetical protein
LISQDDGRNITPNQRIQIRKQIDKFNTTRFFIQFVDTHRALWTFHKEICSFSGKATSWNAVGCRKAGAPTPEEITFNKSNEKQQESLQLNDNCKGKHKNTVAAKWPAPLRQSTHNR